MEFTFMLRQDTPPECCQRDLSGLPVAGSPPPCLFSSSSVVNMPTFLSISIQRAIRFRFPLWIIVPRASKGWPQHSSYCFRSSSFVCPDFIKTETIKRLYFGILCFSHKSRAVTTRISPTEFLISSKIRPSNKMNIQFSSGLAGHDFDVLRVQFSVFRKCCANPGVLNMFENLTKAMPLFPKKDANRSKVLYTLSDFHGSNESFISQALHQCCLKELSVMDMFYICTVQHGSHEPCVATEQQKYDRHK